MRLKKYSISGYGHKIYIKSDFFGSKTESYYQNEDEYFNLTPKTSVLKNYKPKDIYSYTMREKSFTERLKTIKELLKNN